MALRLDPASNEYVSYGDIGAFSGLENLSVALTFRMNSAPAELFLVGKWQGEFLVQITNTDEIGFVVRQPSYHGHRTVGVNVANGGLYRIVTRVYGLGSGSAGMDVWVNGTPATMEAWLTDIAGAAVIPNTTDPLLIGHNNAEGFDGENADYSEWAIWGAKLPDSDCAAYGRGVSPDRLSRAGRILYSPLTRGLEDRWGRVAGTYSGGTFAGHPRVIQRRRRRFVASSTAPSGAISGSSSGAATTSGALTGTAAAAGSSAGTATTAGAVTGAGALAGSSAGAATPIGTLAGAGAMEAAAAGTATTSGALVGTAPGGSSGGTSTCAGTLLGAGALAGAAAGAATATLAVVIAEVDLAAGPVLACVIQADAVFECRIPDDPTLNLRC